MTAIRAIKPGDRVFYPLQGAGIVKDLEMHEFSGRRRKYLSITFPLNKLDILIPQEHVAELGIRPLSTPDVLDQSRARFFEEYKSLPQDPTKRRSLLQSKIKTGSLADEMELIRDLICSGKEPVRLSHHDRYILEVACRMLISEMMFIEDISYDFAKQLVKEDMEIRLNGDEKYFFRYNADL